jgi:HK97 family phage prohead protease
MLHTTKAATATTTELGEFTALAATWSVDRQGDEIKRGAFGATIKRWRESGKRLPVHWDHSGEATNVIGSIDPASMRETKDGLLVKGRLDLEGSETAKAAWRAMREGSMSLSFGYLTTNEHKGADGVNVLTGIDLFEVSIVPAPANDQTRILAMKNAESPMDLGFTMPTSAEIRARVKAMEREEKAEKARTKAAMPIKTATFEV